MDGAVADEKGTGRDCEITTENAGGVENASDVGARFFRENFCDQRAGDSPFSADTHRDKKPERGDLPQIRSKVSEP